MRARDRHNSSWRLNPEEREKFLTGWKYMQIAAAVKWLEMPLNTSVEKFQEALIERGYCKPVCQE